jgi:hypothetical protein
MGDGMSDEILRGTGLTRDELARHTGDPTSFAGIRSVVLDDGPERGVRALEVRTTAGLEFEVLIDRAFDIGTARFRGKPFGWRSGNGFRHPGLHENVGEDGLSWLRALDGLLVTGGLDHTLFGGTVDATQYNYPPKSTVTHGLHGRLTGIPARLLEAREIASERGVVLRLRGEVIQATSFGEHLRLTRTIETDLDGIEIRITDVVENLGYERTPHMFLYHINLGWPYLHEGARFAAPVAGQLWASDSVAEQGVGHRVMPAPILGFVEQVTEHELLTAPDGRARAALIAADGASGVVVEWNAVAMPYFFEWQNLRSGQYGVGFEPSTNHVGGETPARESSELAWLEHGDRREYSTTIRLLDSVDDVRIFDESIA